MLCPQSLARRRRQFAVRGGVLAGLLLLAGMAAPLWAATFTTTLDRDAVTLGETVVLTLTFEGGSPGGAPSLPAIPNVRIGGVSQSSQFSFGTGQGAVSKISYSYPLTPTQAGDITIPGMQIQIGGKVLKSGPLTLKVLKSEAAPKDAAALAQQLTFLRLFVPKKELYVGEMATIELQLCVRQGVQNISGFELTSLPAEGLTVGKSVQGQQRQSQIANVLWTVVPLIMPVTANRAGTLTIGPISASVVVEVPAANTRRRGWPFDDMDFGGFFGRPTERKQVPLATDSVTVQVLPLPADHVPADFNGAVGSFTLTATAGPTNVAVGDPITVKVQISGRGSIETLNLPLNETNQAAWREFRIYPANTKVDLTDQLGQQGTKTFEQVVAPQNAEIKELPPVSFSFFDPEAKQYRTLAQAAVPLIVRPGGSVAMPILPGTSSQPEDKPPAQDIVPIKQRFGSLAQLRAPLIQQPWFLSLQAVPVLAWLGLVVWRKRAEALANNPRLRRQRQVAQVVREGLEELRQHAAENRSDEFFAALFHLLQEQLGERLDLPATAITEAVIEEQLQPRGVPEPLLESLEEFFQKCNMARYAPVRDSQELAAIVPDFEALLRQLKSLKV